MPHTTADSSESRRLVGQARAGEAAAVNHLLSRHRGYVRRVIELRLDRKLRSRVDADDILQETQLEAIRRLPAFLAQTPMPFRLWLRQIACDRVVMARRHHLEAARRAAVRDVTLPDRSSVQLAQRIFSRDPGPHEQLAARDLARRVREAVARMSDADREILLMRNFEELSTQEVACVLKIDPSTVRKRHGQALLRLRQLLLESGLSESEL